MTQPFLKPGVLGPLPIRLGKILAMVGTTVRLALRPDELPVGHLFLMNIISGKEIFQQRRNRAQAILRQEADRR